MNVILGIFGELGTGKTLLASILGYVFSKKYIVYANYHLKNTHYFDPSDLKQFLKIFLNTEKNKNYIFIFDEFYRYIDSRRSMNEKNIIYSALLFQTRKKNINMIYTAQDIYSIDVRIRQITNFYLYPMIDNNILYCDVINPITQEPIKRIRINNIERFYDIYDTYEFVNAKLNKQIEKYLKKEGD
jgi:hypothetical protein